MLMGLVRFGTVVLTADPSPANMVRLLREYEAEQTFIVPTVLRSIVDELQRSGEPAPALSGIYYGAMAMSESLLHAALRMFNCAFVQFFGMTEMSGSATFLSPADHDPARPAAVGNRRQTVSGRSARDPWPGPARTQAQ